MGLAPGNYDFVALYHCLGFSDHVAKHFMMNESLYSCMKLEAQMYNDIETILSVIWKGQYGLNRMGIPIINRRIWIWPFLKWITGSVKCIISAQFDGSWRNLSSNIGSRRRLNVPIRAGVTMTCQNSIRSTWTRLLNCSKNACLESMDLTIVLPPMLSDPGSRLHWIGKGVSKLSWWWDGRQCTNCPTPSELYSDWRGMQKALGYDFVF